MCAEVELTQTARLDEAETKLAELMLYAAGKLLVDPAGGAAKIDGILYLAEFLMVRATGAPITGVPYQKLGRGPAPRRLRPVREQLIGDGSAEMRTDEHCGKPLYRLVPLRDPDVSLCSSDELRMVDQVIAAWEGKNADVGTERWREDMAWQLVDEGDDLPYAAAFLVHRPVVTPASREHARTLAVRLGLRE